MIGTVAERLNETIDESIPEALNKLKKDGHEWDKIAGALMALLQEMTAREGEEIIEDRPREHRNDRRERSERHDDGGRGGRERKPRPPRDEYSGPEEGMVQLFLSLGKRDRINAGDIVGMLHNECQLERGTVGRIKLMPSFSFVEVAKDSAQKAIELAGRAQLRGKSFKLDYDQGPRSSGGRSGGPRSDRGGGGGYRGKSGGGYRDNDERSGRSGKYDRGGRGARGERY